MVNARNVAQIVAQFWEVIHLIMLQEYLVIEMGLETFIV